MTRPLKKSPQQSPHRDPVLLLKAYLQEQVDVVDSLVQVATAKREAILARQLDKIEEAAAQEGRLTDRLASLEDRRSTWINQWASTRSVSQEPFLLSDLIQTLPAAKADTVEAVAAQLVAGLERLDDINRENAGLVYHSLAHVRMLLNAVADVEPEGRVYGPAASSANRPTRGIVEWRA